MKKYALLLVISLQAACTSMSIDNATRVDVYKSDGARQCEGGGMSFEAMQNELGNIKIYAARKDNLRGVMFPAVCGGGTGSVNVYTIDAADVTTAQQRGFAVWQE